MNSVRPGREHICRERFFITQRGSDSPIPGYESTQYDSFPPLCISNSSDSLSSTASEHDDTNSTIASIQSQLDAENTEYRFVSFIRNICHFFMGFSKKDND